jgi:hypothetical protein
VKEEGKKNIPKVHAVDESRARVGPDALVTEGRYVPHELVHDLGQLDGVSRRAGTTSRGTRAAIGDVGLVVGCVEVLAVPASNSDNGC